METNADLVRDVVGLILLFSLLCLVLTRRNALYQSSCINGGHYHMD